MASFQTLSAAILALALVPPAWGATVRYRLYWGGFHAANVALADHVEKHDSYRLRLRADTVGLADLFSPLTITATTRGRRTGFRSLAPGRFFTDANDGGSDTRLVVRFPKGHPSRTSERTRWLHADHDHEKPRPKVPARLRTGTLDPLTALLDLGRRAKIGAKPFTLPVFDGLRRYDVDATVTGTDTVTIGRRPLRAIRVLLVFHPLAGFRPHEMRMWRNAHFIAQIDPATSLPLHIDSRGFVVATVIDARPPPRSRR